MAARPKTLPASMAPVVMGTVMAFGDGLQDFQSAGVALITAILLQIGTNFANDYFDFRKGADTIARIGPQRVTASGFVAPKAMLNAVIFVFGLAVISSVWLILRAGWPIAVIALLAVLSGIFYTAGPWPFGYLGLGETFVLIFFGPVAVAGTYYVQSFEINLAVIIAGLGCGFLSTAILVVNNLRDIRTDRMSNKKTLAVRFGRRFAQCEYLLLVVLASLTPVAVYGIMHDRIGILWAVLVLIFAVPAVQIVYSKKDGPSLNRILHYTGFLLVIYTLLFCVGWML